MLGYEEHLLERGPPQPEMEQEKLHETEFAVGSEYLLQTNYSEKPLIKQSRRGSTFSCLPLHILIVPFHKEAAIR